jgi:hypothetical protein
VDKNTPSYGCLCRVYPVEYIVFMAASGFFHTQTGRRQTLQPGTYG